MKQGKYEINPKIINEIEETYVFDFSVNFKTYDEVTIGIDTIQFYKAEKYTEEYTEDGDREYIKVQDQEEVLYKKNSVSGVYCRVY